MQVSAQQVQAIGHLSEESCAQVTKKFKIELKQQELFNLLASLRRRYEASLFIPDHHQKKDALQQLSKALGKSVAAIDKYSTHLEEPIYEGMLPILGELLSQHGLEKLLGHRLRLPRDVSHARINVALQVGPDLVVSLLNELRQPIDEALGLARLNKGGRPRRHLYRDFVTQELGRNYQRFFGKPPTASVTGRFARFARAILTELRCDLDGFGRTFPALLDALGVLKGAPSGLRQSK